MCFLCLQEDRSESDEDNYIEPTEKPAARKQYRLIIWYRQQNKTIQYAARASLISNASEATNVMYSFIRHNSSLLRNTRDTCVSHVFSLFTF